MATQSDRSYDRRRAEQQQYRAWYNLAAWQQARLTQLANQPLCETCLAGHPAKVEPATVVHHKRAHKGDWALFIDPDNHSSSCKRCHDVAGQFEDHHGFLPDVGADGWPIDPRHPSNHR